MFTASSSKVLKDLTQNSNNGGGKGLFKVQMRYKIIVAHR